MKPKLAKRGNLWYCFSSSVVVSGITPFKAWAMYQAACQRLVRSRAGEGATTLKH